MAYLILNSLLNLNLFLDLSSCHRSMGCPVLNIDFGHSTADLGSIWSPDLSAQTRPSKQCKSRIDVLILRKYLEKENIFFGGGGRRKTEKEKEGKYLEKKNIFLWGRRKRGNVYRRKRRKIFGKVLVYRRLL